LPDAIGCQFLEYGFGRSGRDLDEGVRQFVGPQPWLRSSAKNSGYPLIC
jgi:hypothetical protein